MDETSIRERAVMAKIARRLMPLLVIMFLIAFIDRQNVGFAKLQMVHALGMTETSYGLGASLFFIGYLLFEVPSTLALHRFGARLWLARIMMTWGVITVLLGFTHSTGVFYVFRFLLGVAEAGFYPGVIYYLTLWFPQSHRTRVLGLFTLGSALANMLGSLAAGCCCRSTAGSGSPAGSGYSSRRGCPPSPSRSSHGVTCRNRSSARRSCPTTRSASRSPRSSVRRRPRRCPNRRGARSSIRAC
ncbi:hypothetical protein BMMON2_00240 [Burkholderia mallei]